MEGMNTIKGIVFDFGGVISMPCDPTFLPHVQDLTGWTPEETLAGWKKHRSGMDADTISVRELYRRMAADRGETLSAETLDDIAESDFNAWSQPNPATLEWARQLKAAGYRIGILTNMPTDFIPWFDRCAAAFRALADAEVISGAEHLVKPNPEIYALMVERIGLPPEQLIFLDDTLANVEAARACGWHGHHFKGVEGAAQALADLQNGAQA